MNSKAKSPRRVLRAALAAVALTTAVATTAGTSALAYPPVDDGGQQTPVPDQSQDSSAPTVGVQGALPATGNSNMSMTLVAGGVALLLGAALTSGTIVSNRRRTEAEDPIA